MLPPPAAASAVVSLFPNSTAGHSSVSAVHNSNSNVVDDGNEDRLVMPSPEKSHNGQSDNSSGAFQQQYHGKMRYQLLRDRCRLKIECPSGTAWDRGKRLVSKVVSMWLCL